jgi:hypothetical protein
VESRVGLAGKKRSALFIGPERAARLQDARRRSYGNPHILNEYLSKYQK